jgi:hypothetical protein
MSKDFSSKFLNFYKEVGMIDAPDRDENFY